MLKHHIILLCAIFVGARGQSSCIKSNAIWVEAKEAESYETADECMEKCKTTNGCRFWTFTKPSCSLKFHGAGGLVTGGGPSTETGFPTAKWPGTNKVLVARQLQGIQNVGSCIEECSKDKECTSYIFNERAKTCTFNYGDAETQRLIPTGPNSKLQSGKIDCQGCPSGWKKQNSKCYHISESETTQAGGMTYCKSVNAKATLGKIESEKEWEYVNSIRADNNLWIDGSDRAKEGDWKYADGTSVKFFKWGPGEPNNYQNDEDCIVVWKYTGGVYNDAVCTYPANALCTIDI